MQMPALRYFLAVARLGSIRRAAEELHVAASAISRRIANLEADFGAPLLERHAQGVRLTLAGDVFVRHARGTLRAFERARSDIDDIRGLKRGRVAIGAVEGAVANFLFPALAAFNTRYPEITFGVDIAGTHAIIESIARDEADLGIVFNPPSHPDVAIGVTIRQPLVAVVRRDHPLATTDTVRLTDLTRGPLGLLPASFGTRRLFDLALAEAGARVDSFVTINSIELLKSFVSQGLGITVLPRFAVAPGERGGDLVVRRIEESILNTSHLALCFHRDRQLGAAAGAMLDFLKRELPVFIDMSDAEREGERSLLP